MSIEKNYYDKLNKKQKELVQTLYELGFKYKYFNIYEKPYWGEIDVSRYFIKDNKLGSLLKKVFEQGSDQKRFEIQRVIGI